MILYGKTKVVIERYGIEDTTKVIRNEIIIKVVFGLVSLAFVALFIAIKSPELKEEVWNTIKDFIIYSIALILNIIMGFRSSDVAHSSRIRQSEDRLSIVKNFVGDVEFDKAKNAVIEQSKKLTTEALEAELARLKRIEG